MKRAFLALALAAMTVPALAQVDAKAAKEIRVAYDKVVAALKKKDVKTVMSMMTPDVKMKEMGRTMTRAEFEPMMAQQLQMMELQSADIKFSKLAVRGNTAQAEYRETMRAKLKMPDGKSGQLHSVANYKSTFKKMGGQWKLHYSETLGTPKMTLNGKPFDPNAPPQ